MKTQTSTENTEKKIPKVLVRAQKNAITTKLTRSTTNSSYDKGPWDKGHWENRK